MFDVEFQTSFRHNRILKNFKNLNKEKLVNQSKFFLPKICLRFQASNQMSLPTPLSNLSITFDWRLEISNGFWEMKFNFIF